MSLLNSTDTRKIDNKATSGLSGTSNSLAFRIHEIQKHLHSAEEWYGKNSGDNYFDRDSVTAWSLTAGTSQAYGSEVLLAEGTEVLSGPRMVINKLLVSNTDAAGAETTFKVQLWYGTSTFGAATLLTETCFSVYAATDTILVPIDVACPKIASTSKIWARVKCNVNSKTCKILVGLHTYSA